MHQRLSLTVTLNPASCPEDVELSAWIHSCFGEEACRSCEVSGPAPRDDRARAVLSAAYRALTSLTKTFGFEEELAATRRLLVEMSQSHAKELMHFQQEGRRWSASMERYEDQVRRVAEAVDTSGLKLALKEHQERLQSAESDMQARELAWRSGEVAKMQEVIDRQSREIATLKCSNHVKGLVGEEVVRTTLQEAFADWAFTDTSRSSGYSDLHMADAKGMTVVVEVKNKASVVASDVDKSLRDVRDLAERLAGRLVAYVFVSLRSRNIPHRGSLSLELVDRVPVLWFGVASHEEIRELPRFVSLVACVGRCMLGERKERQAAAALMQRARSYIVQLQRQRGIVNNMFDLLARQKKLLTTLVEGVDAMRLAIENSIEDAKDECAKDECAKDECAKDECAKDECATDECATDECAKDTTEDKVTTPGNTSTCVTCGKAFKDLRRHQARGKCRHAASH